MKKSAEVDRFWEQLKTCFKPAELMPQQSNLRFVILGFFLVAVVLRLVPHAYNVAAIGALGMFVGCYWSLRMGMLTSLAALALSDILGQWFNIPSMGSYEPWLMLVVYSSIALSALAGKAISWKPIREALPLALRVPAGAIAASLLFFLVTNFASWLDPAMGYEQSWAGLLNCYAMGLMFAKNTFLGNLIFSALFFGLYTLAWAPNLQEANAE